MATGISGSGPVALGCVGRWAECKPPGQRSSGVSAQSPTRPMGYGDRVSLRAELDWSKGLPKLKSQLESRFSLA